MEAVERLAGAVSLPGGAGGGVWVRGRGMRAGVPGGVVPSFGLYLGSGRARARFEGGFGWEQVWVEWPDFLLPRDRVLAVREIVALRARAVRGELVEVACGGGVGRTGTVMACLAVLGGLGAPEAVEWARARYHRRAVETAWQRRWVSRFAAEL
ncbi:protein tyrosine phosphatase [Nonomuraea sp. NBC_01738]|uniref:phosphatase domain-containing protein n=1 Tax=Nonomuraea sp. NBC_01738 TaxID=2976003 RepID=UPI002E0F399A|nr:protein tyrosine phosphatase [Nonomuraea sp. NBC_01738]